LRKVGRNKLAKKRISRMEDPTLYKKGKSRKRKAGNREETEEKKNGNGSRTKQTPIQPESDVDSQGS
jgi:hypothetical protein